MTEFVWVFLVFSVLCFLFVIWIWYEAKQKNLLKKMIPEVLSTHEPMTGIELMASTSMNVKNVSISGLYTALYELEKEGVIFADRKNGVPFRYHLGFNPDPYL